MMLPEVTPRVELLAWPTGTADVPVAPAADRPPVDVATVEELGGAVTTQVAVPMTTAARMTRVRTWVGRERRTKWPHDLATPPNGFQRLDPLMRTRGGCDAGGGEHRPPRCRGTRWRS